MVALFRRAFLNGTFRKIDSIADNGNNADVSCCQLLNANSGMHEKDLQKKNNNYNYTMKCVCKPMKAHRKCPDFVITYGDLHLFPSNDSPGCNIMPVVTYFWKWNDANQFIWLCHSKCGHTQTIYIANGRACMRPPPSPPPPSSSFWSHNNQLSHEMVRVHRINYSWRFLHCKIAWNIFQLISIIKARFQSTISLLLFPSAMEERKTEKVEPRIKLQSL